MFSALAMSFLFCVSLWRRLPISFPTHLCRLRFLPCFSTCICFCAPVSALGILFCHFAWGCRGAAAAARFLRLFVCTMLGAKHSRSNRTVHTVHCGRRQRLANAAGMADAFYKCALLLVDFYLTLGIVFFVLIRWFLEKKINLI